MSVNITSAFDGGNIIVQSLADPSDIQLEIRKDAQSDFYQWFYYRLTGARGQECVMRMKNAGGAAYAPGWTGYQAVASYDRQTWFRVATHYRDGILTIRHRPERDSVYYAYFAPYSMERHADLIARTLTDPRARLHVPGHTLDGQDMDILDIGAVDRGALKKIWIIGRQHPGETMAEWLIEGMLERLLDRNDPVARVLLEKAVFYVVPNMNPDGSRRGHLRTNAAGSNLNRAWAEPDMDKSPEVALVRGFMEKIGLDFCLDIHGDEELPYNFVATGQGVPSWTDRQGELADRYKSALVAASPDFQTEKGYPTAPPGKANLQMCTSWVTDRFGALAFTLEQPFKDTTATPSAVHGWSPARAKHLGRATLDALLAVVNDL